MKNFRMVGILLLFVFFLVGSIVTLDAHDIYPLGFGMYIWLTAYFLDKDFPLV